MKHELPKLPYPVDALESHIDARTMEIQLRQKPRDVCSKLERGLEKHPEIQDRSLDELLKDLSKVPEDIRTTARNNGGHWNNSLLWQWVTPRSSGQPVGAVAKAIDKVFGGFAAFKEKFSNAALTRFGSGCAWLTVKDGKLCVCSTPNQDKPLMVGVAECPGVPILGLDVWEHAYYLKYQNRRGEYISAWWNVVN